MYEIKKVNILSLAKVSAFITLACYLVWAIIMVVLMFFIGGYTSRYFFEFNFYNFSILVVLVGLVGSGIAGFGAGALSAVIYNLIAAWTGGLKVDITLEPEEESSQKTGRRET